MYWTKKKNAYRKEALVSVIKSVKGVSVTLSLQVY